MDAIAKEVLLNLLFIPFFTAIVLCILGKIKGVREIVAVAVTGYMSFLLYKLYGVIHTYKIMNFFMGMPLTFKIDYLRWFFLAIAYGAAFLSMVFSWEVYKKKEDLGYYFAVFFGKLLGLTGVFLANDLLTFFIFWEIMSFSTYFMMIDKEKEESIHSAYKYIVISIFGSLLFIIGMVSLNINVSSLEFSAIKNVLPSMSAGYQIFILALLSVSIFVKSSTMPLHYWLPDAYGNTYSVFTSYLASVSARIGLYAFIVLFYLLFGMGVIDKFALNHYFSLRYLFAWIAAITMVVPTFTALMQNDMKKLMTWHGIGQGGYMVVGIIIGTSLGFAGGLFHALNYAVYILLIFLGATAVEYRTGTTNLNKLGGLIVKMPISFLAILFGIIGLAGMPPLNGFVSKWMIYKAAIEYHWPFIALAAIVGTVGTIMSVYKYIHNIFLGQLDEAYKDVKEAPLFMTIPMIILMGIEWGLGMFPGIAMKVISKIEASLGIEPIKYTLTGFDLPTGHIDMLALNMLLGIGFAIALFIFLLGNKRIHVNQYNNYAAGHFLTPDIPFNFNYHFYAAFERTMKPVRKQIINRTVKAVAKGIENFGDFWRQGIFNGSLTAYVFYIILLTVIVLYNI